MNNTAGRGVVLAAVAVFLGAVILWQGFGSTESAAGPDTGSDTGSDTGAETATPTPAATVSDTGGDATTGDETSGDDATAGTTGAETPTTPATDTGGDDVLHPENQVRVKVANGTNTSLAAAGVTNNLSVQNYATLDATNSTDQGSVPDTVVYYLEGYGLDAQNIAGLIGAKAESVLPMPEAPPVADLQDAHVLVVVGDDLAG